MLCSSVSTCLNVMRHAHTHTHMLSTNTACIPTPCCDSRAHCTSNSKPAVISKHTQPIRASLYVSPHVSARYRRICLCSQCLWASDTGSVTEPKWRRLRPNLPKLLRLNSREQLPLGLNTAAQEGHDGWCWRCSCSKHTQLSDAKHQQRDNLSQETQEKKIKAGKGQGEV